MDTSYQKNTHVNLMDKSNASELYQRQLMAKLVAVHHKCLHGFMNKRYDFLSQTGNTNAPKST